MFQKEDLRNNIQSVIDLHHPVWGKRPYSFQSIEHPDVDTSAILSVYDAPCFLEDEHAVKRLPIVVRSNEQSNNSDSKGSKSKADDERIHWKWCSDFQYMR